MEQKFLQQIQQAGLAAGDTLLVAVSGGVDSVVLLHLFCAVSAQHDVQLRVAHLNHQIRPESKEDADFVRRLCAEWDLPCSVECCDVKALAARQKLSLEMAGRQARREFLRRQADEFGAVAIVLGHHRDDQVETFLQRLLRGSGTRGLAAMRPRVGRWWRPLLDCSRQQVLAYAAANHLRWVEDASNQDPIYLRNRLRHQLLPQMRQLNPQLDNRLAELCRQLQVDDAYWSQQVAEVFPALVIADKDGLRLSRQALLPLPEALRVRVLREGLRRVRGDLQRLEAVHLQAVEDLLQGRRSQGQLDLPGCWVARRYEDLWLRTAMAKSLPDYDLSLPVPGEVPLPCGRVLRATLCDRPSDESPWVAEFVWGELDGPLRIRNWRPGDRFAPQGLVGRKQLKRLFGDQKVEIEERSRTPLLVCGETILWVAGLRRSGLAPVTVSSGTILHLELL